MTTTVILMLKAKTIILPRRVCTAGVPAAFVVTRGALGILAPEVALVVADEQDDLQPALQGDLSSQI